MRAIGNLINRLLAMIHPRRARKRKRVTMRYLMLLSMAVSAIPYIDHIFKPIV
jgi:hypothetical protein